MVTAIIVAAGKGTRMQDPLRKQYLSLAGIPILARTLSVFNNCSLIDNIYLVVPQNDFDFCRDNILTADQHSRKIRLVCGGARRQDSVYNGLKEVKPACRIVVIHDGVRPFVQNDQVAACIKGAREFGACILGIPAYDTLKQADKSDFIVKTLRRDDVWLALTPQAFHSELIIKAHERARAEGYAATDDASLVERMGINVKIIRGSRINIKITSKEDLRIAEGLLNSASPGQNLYPQK
jgi:2-C-methyl-D-erythritol 4-phosphate cytidylyltransferase